MLSVETLDRLKAAYWEQRDASPYSIEHRRFQLAILQAARQLGCRSKDWNAMLYAIDRVHPDWRGFVVQIKSASVRGGKVLERQ